MFSLRLAVRLGATLLANRSPLVESRRASSTPLGWLSTLALGATLGSFTLGSFTLGSFTLGSFTLGSSLLGCSPPPSRSPVELEAPSENTTLGPGDTFRLEIVGETDLPKDYQVSADGTVNIPFIHSVTVAGLEPHEIAALVRTKLIEGQILTDPSVVVSVTEYRSKRIAILGQVQEPGSFPLSPGMTLIQALSLGGGLTSIAQANHVTLSRTTSGKVKTVTLDVTAISEGRAPDVPLQPGDRIYVPERVF